MTNYAASLDALHARLGAGANLDLTRAGHRRALLGFLNAWGCRNLAVAWHDLADEVLERWCEETRARLAALAGSPVTLDVAARGDLAEAFDELAGSIAAHKTRDGRELKDAGLVGRTFLDLADMNAQLVAWLDGEANVRDHATTGERPVDRLALEGLTPYAQAKPWRPVAALPPARPRGASFRFAAAPEVAVRPLSVYEEACR